MIQATASVARGASAYSDPAYKLKCLRQAEDMLRAFWSDAADGAPLPPELRGLAEGAQKGVPGVHRRLLMERTGERLRIEATAIGNDQTQFYLWREVVPPASQGEPLSASGVVSGLTRREREVAMLVADGLRSNEVAERLGIAPQTVKSHLKAIFDKLDIRNRVQLARRLRTDPPHWESSSR